MRRCAVHGRISCRDYGCVAADTAHHSRGHNNGFIATAPDNTTRVTVQPEPPAEVVFAVAQYGRFLATRHAAGNARDHVERLLDGEPATTRIVLDFTDVEAVAGAFADELAGELYTRYGARLKLVGGNAEVSDSVCTAVLRRQR